MVLIVGILVLLLWLLVLVILRMNRPGVRFVRRSCCRRAPLTDGLEYVCCFPFCISQAFFQVWAEFSEDSTDFQETHCGIESMCGVFCGVTIAIFIVCAFENGESEILYILSMSTIIWTQSLFSSIAFF